MNSHEEKMTYSDYYFTIQKMRMMNTVKSAIMKKILKVIAGILAVVVVIAGGFWFYCRVINHRSFMAGVVDTVLLVTHRSDKFTYIDVCNEFLKEKDGLNRNPVELPKEKFGVDIREESDGAFQAFIYNDQSSPKQTVFYFHGGAYVNQPNNQQYTMAARTAKETGAEVVLMVYPKAPVYTCSESYDACVKYYLEYIEKNSCGKIVFMGDSAGGGMALGMAELLKEKGETGPEELILISPWADLASDNPDMENYLDKDPMLGIAGMRHIADVWAGNLDIKDPLVSPMYGDLLGLCDVMLFTGDWEILYPDSMILYEKLIDVGVNCRLTVGENMIHCYPIIPAPEAKDAQAIIWETICR